MGNLTRDPSTRQTKTGTSVVTTALAVNDRVPDGQGGYREEAHFLEIVLFGKRAEAFAKFFSKGKPVMVTGRLRQERWQDKETGQPRSKILVVAEEWCFVESGGGARKHGDEDEGGGGRRSGARAPSGGGDDGNFSVPF